MSVRIDEVKLHDGTLIRHKVAGYEGRIEGTTEIKTCFTAGGELLGKSNTKQIYQYRVVIDGESMRRIAPAEDLEILEGVTEVICPRCRLSFQSKPGLAGKPGGRCQCGGWICPSCLACQDTNEETAMPCLKQRKRLARRIAIQKKARLG
ncbi:MAG: hypothetical protein HY694_18315 [Deltaproteobacteria bacterium]|jgi:hypothetical protein|nr:hypothetical protein [Deltaproteobacteria bacterium]